MGERAVDDPLRETPLVVASLRYPRIDASPPAPRPDPVLLLHALRHRIPVWLVDGAGHALDCLHTLFGIEEIGVEVENPFGYDANDLPLRQFCQTIDMDLTELLGLVPTAAVVSEPAPHNESAAAATEATNASLLSSTPV